MGGCRTPIALLLVTGALVSLAGTGRATPQAAALHLPDARTVPMKDPLPDILIDVESGAEDIVDVALSRNRANAISLAADLKESANGPAAMALSASGVPKEKVAELRRRASRLARIAQRGPFVEIALAANAVSQLMPDLYARFRNPVPASILALDYFDREAHLRSLAHQPRKVAVAVNGLQATWPRVRPKVRAAGGRHEAAAFDRHVRAMTELRSDDAKRIQAEALRGLELVDELERVFTR